MARSKTLYLCSECGAQASKWAGQCPDCQQWNTLEEAVVSDASSATKNRFAGFAGAAGGAKVVDLASVDAAAAPRIAAGMDELDRVLGGGIVPGSVVLLGGDPGIGKSTLLLQLMAALVERGRGLYVTGEESLQQVGLRARRLGLAPESLHCLTETCVERVLEAAAQHQPQFMVIDSIQTLFTEQLQSAPGAVAQVRESTARLVRHAKASQTAIFLVGHVTKEGALAGPRVLEHMVDAVLYFESDSGSRYRVVRAIKNRFGAVNELGVFAMTDRGLKPVPNPSAIFLSNEDQRRAGSAVLVTREGTRPLLVEVQALVDASSLANPRRVSLGLDPQRLAMMLAVMHRHGGLQVGDQDVFINVVGGLRINETAGDLPLLFAIQSSLADRPLPERMVSFGEVGLSGEVRPVYNGEERLREAATHGYRLAIVPEGNKPRRMPEGLEVVGVSHVQQALAALDRD